MNFKERHDNISVFCEKSEKGVISILPETEILRICKIRDAAIDEAIMQIENSRKIERAFAIRQTRQPALEQQ